MKLLPINISQDGELRQLQLGDYLNDNTILADYIEFNETTPPATPSNGNMFIYPKTDNKFYQKDGNGTETVITT